MEQARCPVCHIDLPYRVMLLRDWLCGQEGTFHMSQCSQCGTCYLNPRPDEDEIGQFYPESYEAYVRPQSSGRWDVASLFTNVGLERRRRAVLRVKQGGDLLDIGCATGDFAASIARIPGWSATGLEVSSIAARIARERYGLDVINDSVERAELDEARYDVVTMWDTLEHLYCPDLVLDRVLTWLRPGGWLIVRTPSADSIQARIFGEYWAGYDAPRHLSVFNRQALVQLIEARGFRGIRAWTMSGGYALLVHSLDFASKARPSVGGLYRAVRTRPGQVLTHPFVWATDRFAPASITVAAIKPDA